MQQVLYCRYLGRMTRPVDSKAGNVNFVWEYFHWINVHLSHPRNNGSTFTCFSCSDREIIKNNQLWCDSHPGREYCEDGSRNKQDWRYGSTTGSLSSLITRKILVSQFMKVWRPTAVTKLTTNRKSGSEQTIQRVYAQQRCMIYDIQVTLFPIDSLTGW